MCTSSNPKEQTQHKVLRYKKQMDEATSWTDYEFYKELWLVAKQQLRKYSRTTA